jgi:hypothetical protein
VHLHRRSGDGRLSRSVGHDHTIGVPVLIGPVALRIVLLAAVCAVTGFAMLRAFLGAPGRTTAAVVTACAAVGIVLEFMLANGFDLPDQVAVLILAAIAVPLVLAMSRAPGAVSATRHAERLAPWVLAIAAAAAFVEFTRALLGSGDKAILLHTGLMLALAGLSWSTFGLPRWRPGSVAVQIMAAGLAGAAIAGAGYTTALMSGV